MKKLLLAGLILCFSTFLYSQDTIYVRQVLKKLCSAELGGRGYVAGSDKITAFYIQDQFKQMELRSFEKVKDRTGAVQKNFVQFFNVSVNTFPDVVLVRFDKKNVLKPGIDFILDPSCPGVPTLSTYQVLRLEKKFFKNEDAFENFVYKDFSKTCIVIDPELFKKEIETKNEFYARILKNEMKADAIVILESKKLTFGISGTLGTYPIIHILKSKFPEKATEISVQINNTFVPDYETQNVIGWVKGKTNPDSFIVIGAHYDHLGRLGSTAIFEGANDNASGVCMLLDLAKYYADPTNQPDYSIVFIAFGGEELGLLGSAYYTEHPLFPLSSIAFMINLDLMGTGEKGMMVVNATKNRTEFNKLKAINTQKKYLVDVQSRGPAAISDHHSFDVKGVKSFYFYLMGDYPYYHDVNDKMSKLPMGGYLGSFKLITDFLSYLQK